MVTKTKNRLRVMYERASAELDAAQEVYDTIMFQNEGLVQHLEAMIEALETTTQRYTTEDATIEEYEEAQEALLNAETSLKDIAGDASNILAGKKALAYKAYEDYIE